MFNAIIFVSILAICSATVEQTHWICTGVPANAWTSWDCSYGDSNDATNDIYHAADTHHSRSADDSFDSSNDDLHEALSSASSAVDIALMILHMPDEMRVSLGDLHLPSTGSVDHGIEVTVAETDDEAAETDDEATVVTAKVVTHQNWGHHKIQYNHPDTCQQIWVTSAGDVFTKHCRSCDAETCDNCGADDVGC